jgi:hypothetical protein
MIKSEKAVSEVIGMVMILSIMMLVIGSIMLVGVPMIESGKSSAKMDVAMNSFLSLQNDIEEVVRGPIWVIDPSSVTNISESGPSRETEFQLMGGTLSAVPNSNSSSLTYSPPLHDPMITMVSNSTGNYGFRAQATSNNIYANNFPYAAVNSPTPLTNGELNASSDNDTVNYVAEPGKNNNDEIIWVNFTLPNVQSLNYIVVKTTMNTSGSDASVFGIYNNTNAGWDKLNSSGSSSWKYFTYNISSQNEIKNWTHIDANNNLNFSLAVWGNGNSLDSVKLSYFEAYVAYFNVPLNITSRSPDNSTPASINGTSQTFTVNLNHSANVDWYMNGTKIQSNTSVNFASFTNSTAGIGIWNVTAIANDSLSSASTMWNWNVTPIPPPLNITSRGPNSDPSSPYGSPQTFNVTLNHSATVDWYMNGIKIQSNTSVTSAIFTNWTAGVGIWNVTAIANDGLTSKSTMWNWNVTPIPPATPENGSTVVISPGNITYTAGEESIIYENGAVIRKYESGEALMVSDPLISIYNTMDNQTLSTSNLTISIHAISLNGSISSVGGDGKGWVETRVKSYNQTVEPQDYSPNANQVNIKIYSKYPEAWEAFFDTKLNETGLVRRDSNKAGQTGYYIGNISSGSPLDVRIYGNYNTTRKDIFLSVYETQINVRVR